MLITMSEENLDIPVYGDIKLGQFLKLAGLVEDGAEARIAIQSGDVLLNGEIETRRGKTLMVGDLVEIQMPVGYRGARVTAIEDCD